MERMYMCERTRVWKCECVRIVFICLWCWKLSSVVGMSLYVQRRYVLKTSAQKQKPGKKKKESNSTTLVSPHQRTQARWVAGSTTTQHTCTHTYMYWHTRSMYNTFVHYTTAVRMQCSLCLCGSKRQQRLINTLARSYVHSSTRAHRCDPHTHAHTFIQVTSDMCASVFACLRCCMCLVALDYLVGNDETNKQTQQTNKQQHNTTHNTRTHITHKHKQYTRVTTPT